MGQAVLGMEGGAFFHGARRIFSDVTFLLDGERTALVGENGVGKSTLLRCLTGELELNRGKVVRSRNLRCAYLPQEVPGELAELTVRQVLERTLARVGALDEDWRIDVLLDEIEMARAQSEGPFSALSGGWQRLSLIAAAARLEAPDILILDEPTNHLDLGNINVLERWLATEIALPMLVVSHDRAFLSRISSRTLFLREDGAHLFKVPFAQAREALLRRDAAAATQRKLEEREIKRLEAVAARYKVWGVKNSDFHRRQKATESRIAHIEAAKTPVHQAKDRRLDLAEGDMAAKIALRLADLRVATPDGARELLRIDRFALAAGDRVALLGPNGSGKSTLLNALAGAFDPKWVHYDAVGPIRFNPGARLGYFDQTLRDLPLLDSLLDFILAADGVTEREAIRALAQAGFAFAGISEPISTLSYGERSRLAFLKLKLMKPNLYLLDEPTSHLDIEGQEDLETQLESADVACLFVSHDRWFTKASANRFLEIRRGRLIEIESPDAFFAAQE